MPKITYEVKPGIELTLEVETCPFLTEDTMCTVHDKTCCREDVGTTHDDCPLDSETIVVEDD